MSDFKINLLSIIVYFLISVVFIWLAKIIRNIFVPYSLNKELIEKDNPAVGLSLMGYLGGVIVIIACIVHSPPTTIQFNWYKWGVELLITSGYIISGIIVLNLNGIVTSRLILYKFNVEKELINDRNCGTGFVEASGFIATGLIAGASLHGQGGVLDTIIFFVLGQLMLVFISHIYQISCGYDVHKEIAENYEKNGVIYGGNLAAGVAFGANIIAIGIILMGSIWGDFSGWIKDILNFIGYGLGGSVLLWTTRIVVDRIIISGSTLLKEIRDDKNINGAYLEAVLSIGIAIIIAILI